MGESIEDKIAECRQLCKQVQEYQGPGSSEDFSAKVLHAAEALIELQHAGVDTSGLVENE